MDYDTHAAYPATEEHREVTRGSIQRRVYEAIKQGKDYGTALRDAIEHDLGLHVEFLGGEWMA